MRLIHCRVCEAEFRAPRVPVREMMFGFRDRFTYALCPACGCLQLCDPPPDLTRYYPANYYSFDRSRSRGAVGRALRDARNRYALTGRGRVGRIANSVLPFSYPDVPTSLALGGRGTASRVLDVGCGAGWLLSDLRSAGFERLLGVDPYLDGDKTVAGDVPLLKRTIQEVDGTFDLVMFHHVLEHIPDQAATIAAVARLLAPGGVCLVRIPLVSSYAWERYRENWVQIDAPRHFVLHSARSIELLGARAGLRLVRVRYDSTAFQFTGSELYRRDVPLAELDGQFSRREVRSYERWARRLNVEARGDQAAFFFRKE